MVIGPNQKKLNSLVGLKDTMTMEEACGLILERLELLKATNDDLKLTSGKHYENKDKAILQFYKAKSKFYESKFKTEVLVHNKLADLLKDLIAPIYMDEFHHLGINEKDIENGKTSLFDKHT